jgi:hypothetical protein
MSAFPVPQARYDIRSDPQWEIHYPEGSGYTKIRDIRDQVVQELVDKKVMHWMVLIRHHVSAIRIEQRGESFISTIKGYVTSGCGWLAFALMSIANVGQ